VIAVENDPLGVKGLICGASEAKLMDRLTLQETSFEKLPPIDEPFSILADPPRSGLSRVISQMEETHQLPHEIVYVSCWTGTFISDFLRLADLGFRCETLSGVDLFPGTPLTEWVATFKR
jgi:tRNA/tmRNA/rRNA uracil-C5-methylase (TrmA/RlmC/RlmD family)